MKSLFHFFAFDDTYGPGTDLAMVLLGVFILSAAISKKSDSENYARLKEISKNQVKLINALASGYNTGARMDISDNEHKFVIMTGQADSNAIAVRNFETSQLFTFGESLLFPAAKADLKAGGKEVIGKLGEIIKNNEGFIDEIQIQGHADTTVLHASAGIYKSNIELASARATTVFNYFKDHSGIDPSLCLMSIASYGEFKPIQRRTAKTTWDRQLLNDANDTPVKRGRNRRIEIVLIYK